MKLFHLNCGSMRPVPPDAESPGLEPKRAVTHCLLVVTDSLDLVLVDTGIGSADIAQPQASLGTQFLETNQPTLRPAETAAAQIRALGYDPGDVKHIVLTHLDLDHAGGLGDFPDAIVHVSRDELRAATAPGVHPQDRHRYRPMQWLHQPHWSQFDRASGETSWFGFDLIAHPEGLPEDIQLVPLGGHSEGHTGVAVRIRNGGTETERWVLHAGDAYFYHAELDPTNPRTIPGLAYLQSATEVDREKSLGTRARLRELRARHGDQVSVFSAHDPWEFARYSPSASRRDQGAFC